tara:strand:- start:2235 stop:2723 length:489 start_codon:yes stop_codon:yes gene_type:complete
VALKKSNVATDTPLRWSRNETVIKIKNTIIFLILISSLPLLSNETFYYDCEALTNSKGSNKTELYTYKRGEKVHSLIIINKEEDTVSWRKDTFTESSSHIAHYKKDNIYYVHHRIKPGDVINIKFNGVTGVLLDIRTNELTDGSLNWDVTEYQCNKIDTIFK